ncbi:CotH kinase family protein [Bacteroidales bacterium OttesenSCG-928-C03]|nr:CotH kinase family protein [Bacteroidales bacterium OttesenSCG-928-C03]
MPLFGKILKFNVNHKIAIGLLFVFFLCITPIATRVSAQSFTYFGFTAAAIGWETGLDGAIDNQNHTITFTTQRWIEDIAGLSATFTLDSNCVVKVGDTVQTSGSSLNDFRRDVIYTIGDDVHYTVIFKSPQASGLPVIKIETENGAAITSKDVYTNMVSFILDDPNNPDNNILRNDPNLPDEIRGRGNDSWFNPNAQKKSYRVKFRNKTSLFGLEAAKSWVLHAQYRDATFLFNATAFELGDRFGLPFNHSVNFVELYLNGVYKGNFLVTEQNQVGKGRVDIDEDQGWFVELDGYYDEEPKFRTTGYNLPVMIKSPDVDPANISNPAYDFVRNEVNALTSAVASSNFPENGYRDMLNMNTFIDYVMINEICDNREIRQPYSVYMYKDKGDLINMGPLWDFDCGYGYIYGSYTHYHTPATRMLMVTTNFFRKFFDDPVFAVKYKERWNEKYDDIMSIPDYIEEMATMLEKSAAENLKAITWSAPGANNFLGSIANLKNYYNLHAAYLHTEINKVEVCPVSKNLGSVPTGITVAPQYITLVAYDTVSNLTVSLQKGALSSFEIASEIQTIPMGNGGYLIKIGVTPKTSLSVGEYSDKLLLSGKNQGKTFSLESSLSFTVRTASSDATLKSLTINNGSLSPVFNPNTTTYEVNVLHSITSISIEGKATADYATVTGNVTDTSLVVGDNVITITVTAENGTTTKTYTVNVIRAAYVAPKKIYINEISGNDKWLEIYNDEDGVVDLTGYIVQKIDETGATSNWTIPAGTTIAAKGFSTWTRNEPESFTWGISAQRDVAFKLFDNEERELDFFEVRMIHNLYSQGNSRTVGRQTDGDTNLVVFLDGGTKNASNNDGVYETPAPGEGKKIYVNEISGNDKWLELYNAENDSVDLTGYVIWKIDDANEVAVWQIPAGTVLPAKGFKVWTQNVDDGFTWGISAQRDVAFKLFDEGKRELDFFQVKMSDSLYSQGDSRTVGRQTDGHAKLVVFLHGGTKGSSNNLGATRVSDDASLRSLTVSSGNLEPGFSPDITTYAVNVENEVAAITITGVANHDYATVTGNVTDTSLVVGDNMITITVTAEDTVTVRTYTIVVNRGVSGVKDGFVSNMEIYPNPFNDIVHITNAERCTLQVITAVGTIIHSQKISASEEMIKLENLPAGLYFFRLEKDGEVGVVKVIKR